MRAAHAAPLFKLPEGDFNAFCLAGATYCTDGENSTLPQQISPPTRIHERDIYFYFSNDIFAIKLTKYKVDICRKKSYILRYK